VLIIHILNVKHGDSIVVEYNNNNKTVFGLIDSNCTGSKISPALKKLQELNVKKLSFIALTHPDTDHFSGLPQVIEAYKNQIDHFYSFPIGLYANVRLKQIAEVYKKMAISTDSTTIKNKVNTFVKLLVYINKYIGVKKWEEHTGFYNILAPEGFAGLEIATLSPPSKVKSDFFQMIEKNDPRIVQDIKPNKLSLAFSIKYNGNQIILGGDTPKSIWLEHIKFCKRGNIDINGDIVKLPHHGSKNENSLKIINHLFSKKNNIACISANGKTHPHIETLKNIIQKKHFPYCTNLSKECGNNILKLKKLEGPSPKLQRYLRLMMNDVSDEEIQPCKGDLKICFKNNDIKISTQYNNPCPYHGDFNFI